MKRRELRSNTLVCWRFCPACGASKSRIEENFPVNSLLAGNFWPPPRDGFARDCLLQRRVTQTGFLSDISRKQEMPRKPPCPSAQDANQRGAMLAPAAAKTHAPAASS